MSDLNFEFTEECSVAKKFNTSHKDRGLHISSISIDTEFEDTMYTVIKKKTGYDDIKESVKKFNLESGEGEPGIKYFQIAGKGVGKNYRLFIDTDWMMDEEKNEAAHYLIKLISSFSFENEDVNDYFLFYSNIFDKDIFSDIFSESGKIPEVTLVSMKGDAELAEINLRLKADSEESLMAADSLIAERALERGMGLIRHV